MLTEASHLDDEDLVDLLIEYRTLTRAVHRAGASGFANKTGRNHGLRLAEPARTADLD
jgi:hypothetical protein